MDGRQQNEIAHVISVMKKKFISPYKVIYMIDQKQADAFKARNIPPKCSGHSHDHQSHSSCCVPSQIWIPSSEQTKIEKAIAQEICESALKKNMNQLMEFCEDRYQNIIKKGKSDALAVTAEVKKYLVDNILSQSVNHFIYQRVMKVLVQQNKSTNSQIGLWATPATWQAKYPSIKLQLLQGKNLSQLLSGKGWTVICKQKIQQTFNCNNQNLQRQLILLQKDGRFQQKNYANVSSIELETNNSLKNMRNIEDFTLMQDNKKQYFPNLKRMHMAIQSLPFQLNMKTNQYLTLSDNTQISHHKNNVIVRVQTKQNKLSTYKFIVVYNPFYKYWMKQGQEISKGCILLINPDIVKGQIMIKSQKIQKSDQFVFKNYIFQASSKNI